MMHSLFWTTGALVWSVIAVAILWLVVETLLAAANAVSFLRWRYVSAAATKLRWARLPEAFFIQSWRLMFHHRNGDTFYSDDSGGRWCGIGDWSVGHVAVHTEEK